jgi:hypothetical protein
VITQTILSPVSGNLDTGTLAAPCSRGTTRSSFRVPGLTRDIRVKIASERSEFEQAYELLATNYRARGYEAASDKPYRFTPFHALPGTVTVVALDHERVVATLTLVPDSDVLGLPMESIYGPEVAELRAARLRPAEVISLADTDLSIREFLQVFKALIKLVVQFDARRGGDCWIITVNPRHSNFYKKAIGFVPMGSKRSYPSVQNHPAEAHLLTSAIWAANAPQTYQEVFGEDLPEAVLNAHHWSEEHVRYFGARSTQLDEQALEALLVSIVGLGCLTAEPDGTNEQGPVRSGPLRVSRHGSAARARVPSMPKNRATWIRERPLHRCLTRKLRARTQS